MKDGDGCRKSRYKSSVNVTPRSEREADAVDHMRKIRFGRVSPIVSSLTATETPDEYGDRQQLIKKSSRRYSKIKNECIAGLTEERLSDALANKLHLVVRNLNVCQA